MKKTTRPNREAARRLVCWAILGGRGLVLNLGLGLAGVPAAAAQPISTRGPADVFIRAVPSSPSVYAGQVLSVRYWLYYCVPVIDADADIALKFKNCWVEEYPPVPQERTETLGGKVFRVRLLKHYLVVPELEGALQLPVLTQRYSRKAPPAPEDFFGEPRMVALRVRSHPVQVPVRALPAPPDLAGTFSNAVGSFRFRPSYRVSRKSDNLLTVRLQVTGPGDLRKIRLLPPLLPAGVDAFNSVGAEKHTLMAKGFAAEYTYSYDAVANYRGTYALPGLRVLSFDPDKGRYEVYAAPAFIWRVATGPPPRPAARVGNTARLGLYTKYALFQDQHLFLGSRTCYGLLLLAGLFFAVGLVQAERRRARTANPGLYLARRARKMALKALDRTALTDSQPVDVFCKRLHDILTDYLDAALGLGSKPGSLRDWPARHQDRAVPVALQQQTVRFLDALAKFRFAGGPPPAPDRRRYSDELRDLITQLDARVHDNIPAATLGPASR